MKLTTQTNTQLKFQNPLSVNRNSKLHSYFYLHTWEGGSDLSAPVARNMKPMLIGLFSHAIAQSYPGKIKLLHKQYLETETSYASQKIHYKKCTLVEKKRKES